MKKLTQETEVVTVEGIFDGIMVNDCYYSRGEARHSKDALVRSQYWRARRAMRNNSYSLEDAPLKQYSDGGKQICHHDLKECDE